jgi:glycogen(starch) synthase
MINKRIIVLASLLKPVNEPRIYDKIGRSLAETNKYEVNIIGFYTKNIPTHPNIHFHPLFRFKRLSLKRLLAPLKFGRFLLKVKPELIIVNSHDLLMVSVLFRILFGGKLIYDVQENYQQNIIWSSDLPIPFRWLAARLVSWKERVASRMIIHFFIAEACYLNECSFINSSSTLLENKARALPLAAQRKKVVFSSSTVRFIYSGTIAESYGIFDCLALVKRWKQAGHDCHLLIIGHCPREDTLKEIQAFIKDKPYIQLQGGPEPIPHSTIRAALLEADFAFISYRLNPSNQNCFPTRIWECLAYKVPMLMKQEHPWNYLLKEYGAGFAIDFQAPNPEWPFKKGGNFYQKKPIPKTYYWEWEAKKLLSAVENLF